MRLKNMQLTNSPETVRYYLGIDGGGTKCKARLTDLRGVVLAEAVAGPANIATDLSESKHSILDVCQKLLQQAQLAPDLLAHCGVVAGLAGANLPSAAARFGHWQHPFAWLHLTTDLHIACLGAHAGADGAMLICGTGTAAFSIVDGQQALFSAQGFPLGDKGSGAWLGWRAISHTLDVLDGLALADALSAAVLARLLPRTQAQATDLISACRDFRATDFATLAPLVFEAAQAKDQAALSILQDGVGYLESLLRRLMWTGAQQIAMAGGVATAIKAFLADEWQQHLSAVAAPPEAGAVLLAQQLASQQLTQSQLLDSQLLDSQLLDSELSDDIGGPDRFVAVPRSIA